MTTPIKPLADRVVATKEQAKTQTASGIYLPDTAKEKPVFATVEAVGPDVKSVKKGDKILYKEYSMTELTVDKTDYIIVKEEDVLAVIQPGWQNDEIDKKEIARANFIERNEKKGKK